MEASLKSDLVLCRPFVNIAKDLWFPWCSAGLQVGETVDMPVRVNTSGMHLQAADVELRIDEQVLVAVGCRPGAQAVRRSGFECRFNMFGHLDSVQISYIDDRLLPLQAAALASDVPAELAVIAIQVCASSSICSRLGHFFQSVSGGPESQLAFTAMAPCVPILKSVSRQLSVTEHKACW
jgi:hypothetical protein